MTVIRFRDEENDEFVEIPLGSVSEEQLEEILDIYLDENPIEVDSYTKAEIDNKLSGKANSATTLAGYGIIDAYTQEELDEEFSVITEELNRKMDDITEYGSLETANKTVLGSINEVNSNINLKLQETVLYEDVINTPEWTNQPACEGVLDSAFTTTDFYYVTLKDANGNDLPSGQFMLKDFYTDGATVYSTVFSLDGLNTGTDTLVENYPVEFSSVGVHFRMRDAGVWDVTFTPDQWMMSGNRGQLRLVCSGEYVQRMSNAYFVTIGISDKNVSHYHSTHTTTFQSDSTKQIIPYAAISSVQSYKTNQFYDDFTIERLSDTHYLTKRNMTMRCMSYGSTAYTVSSQMVIGHGELLNENTILNNISIRTAVKNDRGFIRNGSVIRVTEVK